MERIQRKQLSREEIVAEIQAYQQETGRVPSFRKLKARVDVTGRRMRKLFGSWTGALRASGVKPERRGMPVEMETLFHEWVEIARKLGRTPSGHEYERLSRFSVVPLRRRFHAWSKVPAGIMEYAEQKGLSSEYQDVAGMIARQEECKRPRAPKPVPPTPEQWKAQLWPGRTVYGAPISMASCEPASEEGVIFLFGMMAKSLGFSPTKIQRAFPDCEAFCRIDDNKCQLVKIEFELESMNFVHHMHDPAGCDIVVCWVHNWRECPLPVIELKKELRRLVMSGEM